MTVQSVSWGAKAHYAHDLVELAPGLWLATGQMEDGPRLLRNMVVYRLPDGGLLLHGAHAADDAVMQRIESLGRPAVMVVASQFHELYERKFKERYPDLRVVAPAGSIAGLAPTIAVDAPAEEALPPLGVTVHRIPGTKGFELCYELPVERGVALVVGDVLFNLPHQPGWRGAILKLLGSSGFFGLTRIGKAFLVQDLGEFKRWLLALAERSEIVAVCVGHGDAITAEVPRKLREAAARL